MNDNKMLPHSMRCLKAIEAYCGGREKLAELLGLSQPAIARWVQEGKIPRAWILSLIKLSEDRFTAEELLGARDADKG